MFKKKVMILGGDGMLGKELSAVFKADSKYVVKRANKNFLDITNYKEVQDVISRFKPDLVINAAAFIDVEKCEKFPDLAFDINGRGPGNIASGLISNGLFNTALIQISTCDVFGNDKVFYSKNDAPNPINTYGKSKLMGEINVCNICNNQLRYYIVRTSWLYSCYKDTFIDFIVKKLKNGESVKVIGDQYNLPTWAFDLAHAIKRLYESKFNSGIYHLLNSYKNRVTKYDIAVYIANILSINKDFLVKVKINEVLKTVRPNSPFLKQDSNIKLPSWKKSLKNFLTIKYVKK